MNAARYILAVTCVSLCLAIPAMGDWLPEPPNDPTNHKMHWPQMPDPLGWDVQGVNITLADDWKCSQTGPVTDIHLWGSIYSDATGIADPVNIHVSIHDNIPADPITPYSRPGALLREWDFPAGSFTVRDYDTGDQGWFDPETGLPEPNNHSRYHQINIVDIPDPFVQRQGEIYWLDIQVQTQFGLPWWGWKTSQDHFADVAVWSVPGGQWEPLYDPTSPVQLPLDFAFVITPEPGTLALVALGGALALIRRRRQR